MGFEIKYESGFYRIEVDAGSGLLSAKWLRPVSADEIIRGGTKLYEVLQETQVERVVANAQALGALTSEAKEWMSTRFYELLSGTSLKKMARVLPDTVFHRIALESVVTRAEALGITKFLVKNFSRQQEALLWLDF
ncbi:hypothetical protein CLV24_12016 [Pontibacter ummariensis]|uniref:SpoIIAA-like n=2 Tax=Pontibacter ummariensis TaxID=1610492 RepID=A0A239J2U4_9BACT|nr:hypothetical protein CLV24_12016 [Pontibacter ummariensis]SNT00109.1 hypothetical protein SAMN06296052_12015 [Pontibacter ummariensis]